MAEKGETSAARHPATTSGPMIITDSPSPNYNERFFPTTGGRRAISLIILHYTDLPSAAEARALMQDPTHQACAHYLVDTTGAIERLVPDERRAWHAGRSHWAGEDDLNSLSLGIEIQNAGHRGGAPAYPWAQISAVIDLCRDLCQRHGLDGQAILGHSDIAPDRKIDPGEWFPWEKLHTHGLGFWPNPGMADKAEGLALTDDGIRAHLTACGYNPALDLKTLITAFQRHFVPEAFLDGGNAGHADILTRTRLVDAAHHARARGGALAFPRQSA